MANYNKACPRCKRRHIPANTCPPKKAAKKKTTGKK